MNGLARFKFYVHQNHQIDLQILFRLARKKNLCVQFDSDVYIAASFCCVWHILNDTKIFQQFFCSFHF